MIRYNKAAAKTIFESNNKKRSLDEIDLHGLHVKEALDRVQERIEACKSSKKKKLVRNPYIFI